MTEFRIDTDELRRLTRLVEENGLSEMRYEEGDLRITLRTAAFKASAAGPPVTMVAPYEDSENDFPRVLPAEAPVAASATSSFDPSVPTIRVEAPVMGVFYRAPAPGEPPFVEVGDMVEVGQPVGMIEAMKVFSEVLAEAAGRVREASAKNGALVQPGETLLVLEVIE